MEEWLECEVEYEVWLDGCMIHNGITDDEESAHAEANEFIADDCYGTSYTPDDYEVRIL